jgi:hypothetical protein
MSETLGAWLRRQREDRDWAIPDMAHQILWAGKVSDDRHLPNAATMCHYIRRWEADKGGLSERYTRHYSKALGIPRDTFGPSGSSQTHASDLVPPQQRSPAVQMWGKSSLLDVQSTAMLAYREDGAPDLGDSTVEREVLMMAHEGSGRAEDAEQRGIGDATLEQLRADVTRLSHDYMTGEPLLMLRDMRRVRNRIDATLDRRQWPRDAAELYFLLGCINCLMAVAADDLGYSASAEELTRTGWAYAVAIDHRPLMAQLRLQMANIAYWTRPRRSADLALMASTYMPDGPNAAQIHLRRARSAASIGNVDTARSELDAADEARTREHWDELLEIGGEFGFSRATQQYLVGSTLLKIPEETTRAVSELDGAVALYAAGPVPGEDHSTECAMLARVDLALALLRADNLDAAKGALQPVIDLPPGRRFQSLERLATVRTELSRPSFRGSTQARELDEQIEDYRYGREAMVGAMAELPT